METIASPKKHKWLFWIILGAFSAFFAEVFAGSDMFPFFNIWGILIVWPLYGLHTILLTTIIFRYGKPTLSTLIFAGMLFGLYEAYMTKVLWQPSWEAVLIIGDVALLEIFVLVFWWHTWFSFVTPLLLGERLLTTSQHTLNGITGKTQRFYNSWKGYLALIVFGGIFQSINSPSVGHSLLSGVSTGGFLFFLTWLWRRMTQGRIYTLPELLPNKKEFRSLAIWLGLLYLVLGFSAYPERIPGLLGQGLILGFYIVVIALFVRALRASVQEEHADIEAPMVAIKHWLIIWFVFVIVLVLTRAFFSTASGFIAVVSWLGGSAFGLGMFVKAVRALKR